MLKKLQKVEQALSAKHGDFALFGLFLRADAPARWDLVLASDWTADRFAAIKIVADALIETLTKEEAVLISRIVPLRPDDQFLRSVCRTISVRHGLEKVSGEFGMISISEGYVISCGGPGGR